jgi:hypothetical protein
MVNGPEKVGKIASCNGEFCQKEQENCVLQEKKRQWR